MSSASTATLARPIVAAPTSARSLSFAALIGAAGVLSFAPFGYWPLQFFSLAYLFYQIGQNTDLKRSALIGWAYGFGWCSAGVYWLYIAMHSFGDMPAPLAALAVCLMGAYLGLFSALAASAATWLRRRWSLPLTSFALLVLPACWGASEWTRGWLFTGLPWAVSGYAHNISPLAGYAPLIGVYGIGTLAAVIAGALMLLTQRARLLAVGLIGALMLGGLGLHTIVWTHAAGKPISVRLLQSNVAQDEKFSEQHIASTLALVRTMIVAQPADLIATPETAIVQFPQQLPDDYLSSLSAFAANSGSHLVLGIPLADTPTIYANSVLGVSPRSMVAPYRYDKHHLVPFGEFVPLGFRWFVDLLRIPLGNFTRGAPLQAPFAVKDQLVLPNICYEDLFGEEIADQLRSAPHPANILLNVSNLAWYGESSAIAQHLQISQMRTLETGRPMLRSTNTGATAIIDARGEVVARLPAASRATLAGQVQGMAGRTPYIMFGNAAFLLMLVAALLAAWLSGRKTSKNVEEVT